MNLTSLLISQTIAANFNVKLDKHDEWPTTGCSYELINPTNKTINYCTIYVEDSFTFGIQINIFVQYKDDLIKCRTIDVIHTDTVSTIINKMTEVFKHVEAGTFESNVED